MLLEQLACFSFLGDAGAISMLVVVSSLWPFVIGYGGKGDMHDAMGSKRSYHQLHQHVRLKWPPQEKCDGDVDAVVVIARHGQRFPTKSKLARYIDTLVSRGVGNPLLGTWAEESKADSCFASRNAEQLHPRGVEEMRLLGAEIASLLPSSLPITVMTSPAQRCIDSCHALGDEIGKRIGSQERLLVSTNSEVLQSYKHCPRYHREKSTYLHETKEYLKAFSQDVSYHVKEMTDLDFDHESVLGLYYACQAHYSCYGPIQNYTPCQLVARWMHNFSMVEDLENFYIRGPASKIGRPYTRNGNMAEALGLLALQLLGTLSKGVHLWCTHDTVLYPLITLLDLFDLGDDAAKSNSSRIMPMASRLVLRRTRERICIDYNGRLARVMSQDEWAALLSSMPSFNSLCQHEEI